MRLPGWGEDGGSKIEVNAPGFLIVQGFMRRLVPETGSHVGNIQPCIDSNISFVLMKIRSFSKGNNTKCVNGA